MQLVFFVSGNTCVYKPSCIETCCNCDVCVDDNIMYIMTTANCCYALVFIIEHGDDTICLLHFLDLFFHCHFPW